MAQMKHFCSICVSHIKFQNTELCMLQIKTHQKSSINENVMCTYHVYTLLTVLPMEPRMSKLALKMHSRTVSQLQQQYKI
jgi:hypothetical protein